MQENLKTTKYRNGDAIGSTAPADLDIRSQTSPKYQWPSGGAESNVNTYGRLYTWYAATDSRGVCPAGWHLPTDGECTTLANFLGDIVAGGKMKEAGTTHWFPSNTGADNSSGFTALPAGDRLRNGTFDDVGDGGYWWSATSLSTTIAYRCLGCNNTSAYRSIGGKEFGFSVRCVRD